MDTEMQLKTNASVAVRIAKDIIVDSRADYAGAGNMRKELKDTIKQMEAYWSPLIESAHKAHKELVARKKEMTEPLEQADKIINDRMMAFWRAQEVIRLAAEEEQRQRDADAAKAAQEAAQLVREAQQKEELDEDDVAILQMAQNTANMTALAADTAPVIAPVKMQGVSVRQVWKARVVDDKLVPVTFGGWPIRPVDMGVLNKIASGTQGKCEVPGVEFYQEQISSVRL